jgi:hypothetical protein
MCKYLCLFLRFLEVAKDIYKNSSSVSAWLNLKSGVASQDQFSLTKPCLLCLGINRILLHLSRFCEKYPSTHETGISIYGSTALCWILAAFSVSSGILGQGISSSQCRYLHTEQHKHRLNSNRVGFEPTISLFERTKTVHTLDSVAFMIGETGICR